MQYFSYYSQGFHESLQFHEMNHATSSCHAMPFSEETERKQLLIENEAHLLHPGTLLREMIYIKSSTCINLRIPYLRNSLMAPHQRHKWHDTTATPWTSTQTLRFDDCWEREDWLMRTRKKGVYQIKEGSACNGNCLDLNESWLEWLLWGVM